MASAWGASFGSAWGSAWGIRQEKPQKPSVEWMGGGGSLSRLDIGQSAEDKRREREALGILPAEVERIVEVVARIEARDLSDGAEQRAIEALARELEQENIAWREAYAEAMRDVLRQIIDAELRDRLRRWNEEQDEEAAMLMRWFLDM